jgi:hypothetical protein
MRRKQNFIAGLVAALAVTSAAVAVAGVPAAPSAPDAGRAQAEPPPVADEIVAAFPVLATPSRSTDDAGRDVLRDQLGAASAGANGSIGAADFGLARSSRIAGSAERAWLVPSGAKACLAVPDPIDGYGATCSTLSAIKAGRGFLILGAVPGSRAKELRVAVLVPRGGEAPRVRNEDGSARALAVDGNVAAEVLPTDTGASLEMGPVSLSLATLARPSTPVEGDRP